MSLVCFISFPAGPATAAVRCGAVRCDNRSQERRVKVIGAGLWLGDGGGKAEDGEGCGGEKRAAGALTESGSWHSSCTSIFLLNSADVPVTELMIEV